MLGYAHQKSETEKKRARIAEYCHDVALWEEGERKYLPPEWRKGRPPSKGKEMCKSINN